MYVCKSSMLKHAASARACACSSQIYTVPNDPAATDADVKLVLDMSPKVEQNAELSFQYLPLSPDFAITKCM